MRATAGLATSISLSVLSAPGARSARVRATPAPFCRSREPLQTMTYGLEYHFADPVPRRAGAKAPSDVGVAESLMRSNPLPAPERKSGGGSSINRRERYWNETHTVVRGVSRGDRHHRNGSDTRGTAGTARAETYPVFVGPLNQTQVLASTVPANGDVNPYGMAVVRKSTGSLYKGNVLVSNFNDSSNVQGTGTTIVQVTPSGQQTLFAQINPNLPGCPGGVGLTTALTVLPTGWVIIGSLPHRLDRRFLTPAPSRHQDPPRPASPPSVAAGTTGSFGACRQKGRPPLAQHRPSPSGAGALGAQ
jgi:hypothetical protein